MPPNRPIKFVATGFASPADDFAERALDLNKFLIKHPASTFFMRSKGGGNQKYGIFDNDILVVDRSLESSRQALNLMIIDDEFKVADFTALQKLRKQKTIEAEFWGVVVSVIRKF